MKSKIPCLNSEECTGCLACYNVCKFSAIELTNDNDGFITPIINENKCKQCQQCYNVCKNLSKQNTNYIDKSFGLQIKSPIIRQASSSGGAFTAIASLILNDGGIVFGAAYNEEFNVEHIMIDNINQLFKLRGAKYIQSNIKETYKEAKKYLDQGIPVYFTGTPCQIAGLKSSLGKEYDNLLCSDLICHGVPSSKVWQKYLSDNCGKDIKEVDFRDKRYGWTKYSLRVDTCNNSFVFNRNENTYMKGYIDNYFLRESCYNCKFKGMKRASDITLADFWGLNEINPDFDKEDLGTSLILVNTDKGNSIINRISNQVNLFEVDKTKALKYNQSALKSSFYPIQRTRFLKNIDNINYNDLLKTIEKLTIYERIKLKIK